MILPAVRSLKHKRSMKEYKMEAKNRKRARIADAEQISYGFCQS